MLKVIVITVDAVWLKRIEEGFEREEIQVSPSLTYMPVNWG